MSLVTSCFPKTQHWVAQPPTYWCCLWLCTEITIHTATCRGKQETKIYSYYIPLIFTNSELQRWTMDDEHSFRAPVDVPMQTKQYNKISRVLTKLWFLWSWSWCKWTIPGECLSQSRDVYIIKKENIWTTFFLFRKNHTNLTCPVCPRHTHSVKIHTTHKPSWGSDVVQTKNVNMYIFVVERKNNETQQPWLMEDECWTINNKVYNTMTTT